MAEALEEYLRERQGLLLLDNFERLLEAGPPLARQRALNQDSDYSAARAKVLVGDGRLAWFQGEFSRGNTLVEESLDLHRDLDDDAGIAFALLVLGRTAVSQGNLVRGKPLSRRALRLFANRETRGESPGRSSSWGIAHSSRVMSTARYPDSRRPWISPGISRMRRGSPCQCSTWDAQRTCRATTRARIRCSRKA